MGPPESRSMFFPTASRAAWAARLRAAPAFFKFGHDLQSRQRVVPHPLEHVGHGPERVALGPIESPLLVGPCLDQTRGRQRSQLLRDGAKRHIRHGARYFTGADFAIPNETKNLATAWRCDGGENGRLGKHACILV